MSGHEPANISQNPDNAALNRRAVLVGGGLGTASAALLVTGCSVVTVRPGRPSGPAELGPSDAIPVGGGTVFAAQQVVVTQPAPHQFRAFSAICTHAGCEVSGVGGGTINCACHGSAFRITDGSVANGPARRPLPTKQISTDGGILRLR